MATRRAVLLTLAALGACQRRAEPKEIARPRPARGSLEWAVAGPWRIDPDRDRWRHPVETLRFFGLQPGMTVLETFPGRGWYSAILAPFLAVGKGVLIAASFDPATATKAQAKTLAFYRETFVEHPETFGDVRMSVLAPKAPAPAAANTVDLVFVARNVDVMLSQGFAEEAFAGFFAALKPGGTLGLVQHRAPPSATLDMLAPTGYVQEAVVKLLAKEAGFAFVGASEINANPKDDHDHPFGVWTLPPTLQTAPDGAPPDPTFDTAPYKAIGESDRMTLKFQKPG